MQVAAESPQKVPGMLAAARRPIVVQNDRRPHAGKLLLLPIQRLTVHIHYTCLYTGLAATALCVNTLPYCAASGEFTPLASACCGRANQISLYDLHY